MYARKGRSNMAIFNGRHSPKLNICLWTQTNVTQIETYQEQETSNRYQITFEPVECSSARPEPYHTCIEDPRAHSKSNDIMKQGATT